MRDDPGKPARAQTRGLCRLVRTGIVGSGGPAPAPPDVRRGPGPGASGASRPVRLHPRRRLGLLLQAPARGDAPDRRFPDTRRLPGVAERALSHRGSQHRADYERGGVGGAGQRPAGSVRQDPASRHRGSLGSVARRGDGGRAPGRPRASKRARTHGAFPAGAGRSVEAGRDWERPRATPARCRSIYCPMLWASARSISIVCCANCAKRAF